MNVIHPVSSVSPEPSENGNGAIAHIAPVVRPIADEKLKCRIRSVELAVEHREGETPIGHLYRTVLALQHSMPKDPEYPETDAWTGKRTF